MQSAREKLAAWRSRRGPDVALAIGLCAVALVETAINGELRSVGLAIPFLTLTLAWRRTRALLVGGLAALALLSLGPDPGIPSIAMVAGVCGISYSAGAYLPRGRALAVACMLVGALVGQATLHPDGDLADLLFSVVVLIGPWPLGRLVRVQREQESAIAAVAALLDRERRRHDELAVEAERLQVARELHDTVAADLNLMIIQAAVAEGTALTDARSAAQAVGLVQESGRRASGDLRRLVNVLRAPVQAELGPMPGLDGLAALVERARAAGVDAALTVTGVRPPMPAGLELSAYRIVQEALSNVLKHAAGARSDVVVRYTQDAVELEVSDGGGVRASVPGGGHGIVGMRERAAVFGGELDAAPTHDGGFAVHVRLPLGAVVG